MTTEHTTVPIKEVLSKFPEGTPAGDAGRARNEVESETWYEIEIARNDTDDWFRFGADTYDTSKRAGEFVDLYNASYNGFRARRVKVTMTREVL